MQIENAQIPSAAQMQAALQRDDGSEIYMLNLLKFRPQAAYADGRQSDLTGQQAYSIYGRAMTRMVMEAGGKLVYAGQVRGLLVGGGDAQWDQVAIMMYPSFKVMAAITGSQAYADIHVHREAGLAGQVLIETVKPQTLPR
jgi:uncharacterized protein (DUF1330 family)